MTEQPTSPQNETETEVPAPVFNQDIPHATPERPLSEAARRALLEAAERRAKTEAAQAQTLGKEHGGPRGLEPTRFGDWEKKGLAIDF